MLLSTTPATARQEVMLELCALGAPSHCPLGMYVIPAKDDVFKWSGVLFIHKGYYSKTCAAFTLTIPNNYPLAPPVVHFQTDLFHPLVDPATGRFALASRFPSWRPRVDFLFHVLHFVKSAFKRASLDSLREAGCLNKEAYRLYRDQTPLFTKLAAQSAQLSLTDSALYGRSAAAAARSPNPSEIRFRKLEEGEEEELRRKLEAEGRARLARPEEFGGEVAL